MQPQITVPTCHGYKHENGETISAPENGNNNECCTCRHRSQCPYVFIDFVDGTRHILFVCSCTPASFIISSRCENTSKRWRIERWTVCNVDGGARVKHQRLKSIASIYRTNLCRICEKCLVNCIECAPCTCCHSPRLVSSHCSQPLQFCPFRILICFFLPSSFFFFFTLIGQRNSD